MDWKSYEQITKYIYENLGKDHGVTVECFGNNCKVEGKSGVRHQVDVLTSFTDGVHFYKTAIECKYWEETINKDIVMKVSEIIEDAKINKGVIVSKKGFTPDAITFASYKNIGLVELREATATESDSYSPFKDIKTSILRAEITSLTIIPKDSKTVLPSENIDSSLIIIKRYDNKVIEMISIIDDFKKELQESKVGTNKVKKIPLPFSELTNRKTKKTININGLVLEGKLNEIPIDLKFYKSDYVWLIMKSIFEDKKYAIYYSGLISEDKNNKGTNN
jgi:hypothetical protein